RRKRDPHARRREARAEQEGPEARAPERRHERLDLAQRRETLRDALRPPHERERLPLVPHGQPGRDPEARDRREARPGLARPREGGVLHGQARRARLQMTLRARSWPHAPSTSWPADLRIFVKTPRRESSRAIARARSAVGRESSRPSTR